jgi:CopG family nickel-responsive transcriptional regulator
MAEIIRFGVSISPSLLERFDRLAEAKGYTNRSEAIRDLIRDRLVETEWEKGDQEVVGTITIVYDHETRELTDRLIDFQHQYVGSIISTMHIHLNEHNCLEVMVVRGHGRAIREIAERLIGTKGVRHGKLTMTSVGEGLS